MFPHHDDSVGSPVKGGFPMRFSASKRLLRFSQSPKQVACPPPFLLQSKLTHHTTACLYSVINITWNPSHQCLSMKEAPKLKGQCPRVRNTHQIQKCLSYQQNKQIKTLPFPITPFGRHFVIKKCFFIHNTS